MLQPNAFRDAEAYTWEQERTLGFVPDDELDSFVISSIEKLAMDHIQPITHAVSQTIGQTEDGWIRLFLSNSADNPMVSPPIKNALPARYSEGSSRDDVDSLLLPMDGALLKIKAAAPAQKPRNAVLMIITSYSMASKEEAAILADRRARTKNPIDPEATIIMPRKTIDYQRRSYYNDAGFACTYWEWDDPIKMIGFYNTSAAPLPPEQFRTMHQAFMREGRVALSSVRSALAQPDMPTGHSLQSKDGTGTLRRMPSDEYRDS